MDPAIRSKINNESSLAKLNEMIKQFYTEKNFAAANVAFTKVILLIKQTDDWAALAQAYENQAAVLDLLGKSRAAAEKRREATIARRHVNKQAHPDPIGAFSPAELLLSGRSFRSGVSDERIDFSGDGTCRVSGWIVSNPVRKYLVNYVGSGYPSVVIYNGNDNRYYDLRRATSGGLRLTKHTEKDVSGGLIEYIGPKGRTRDPR